MKHHESEIQAACVKWFRYQHPDKVLFSIPNGGFRRYQTAVRLRKEGALAGVPDLFLAAANKTYHGLFIEMKFGSGKQTDNQLKISDRLMIAGYDVVVCRSVDEFMEAVENYLKS